jgi:NADH-quinone oxidoreductase subunit K
VIADFFPADLFEGLCYLTSAVLHLSVNFLFLISSVYLDDRVGQLFTLFILSVAAAETSIGLAILVAFYRLKGTIAVSFVSRLKG